MWTKVPMGVKILCQTIERAGGQAFPVGGAVRDLLLGRAPGDWDVTTSLLPQTIMDLFQRTIPTGLVHGTVTVLTQDGPVEVTTFRREIGYSDGRHPDGVDFDVTLEEDLARRDFTINALALAPDGRVIDPFGGQSDLKWGLVRCVGRAEVRFEEDGLRLLRALRFAAQLGFGLEEETARAVVTKANVLDRVSAERVKAEVEKILLSPEPDNLTLAVRLGMLNRFGATYHGPLDFEGVPCTQVDRWSALCRATGLDITALPVERSLRQGVLHPERQLLERLPITGGDLYALGYRGAEIGQMRWKLLQTWLEHPDCERETLLKQVGLPHEKRSEIHGNPPPFGGEGDRKNRG